MSRRGRHRRDRGQSLVELAIIAPVFLLLLLTSIDLGRLLYSQITITNAAKEGALVASQGGTFQSNQGCSDTNTVMCGVLTEATGGFVEVDQARVTLSPATCDPNAMYPPSGTPPTVTVNIEAPFRVVTPIIGSIVGNNLTLGAEADAQCLVVPAVTYPSIPSPTAAFSANPTSGNVPPALTVNVDASASSSPGATITDYSWSFGGSGVSASTTYSTAGTYTIVLTVTDSRGQTDTESRVITVAGGPPPCATVSFTWTDTSNPGNPHRLRLSGSVAPSGGAWSWTWTGPTVPPGTSGANPQVNFPTSGPHAVTLTAIKGACTATTSQVVTAP